VLIIASRFMIGLALGLPASLLVINRRLYKIASRTQAVTMKSERLRAVYVDLAIGLLIPALEMILRKSTQIALHPLSDLAFQRSLLRDTASTFSKKSDAFQISITSLWHTL